MRRLSAALVAITAAIALVALAAPAWTKPKPKAKTMSKALTVSPAEVRDGQSVKVSGGGCQGITVLVFLIDKKEFHRGYTKGGDFTYEVKLPRGLENGSHSMSAECRGSRHTPARFNVSKKSRGWEDDEKCDVEAWYEDDEESDNEGSYEDDEETDDETSRPDGKVVIESTENPGRATSVTVAVPTGTVIGRLQPPTGTSMVPSRPATWKPKVPVTPCPDATLQISSVPVGSGAADAVPTAPTTEMVVTTSADTSSRSRPTRFR